ncbi:MAG TPA: BACON domain-containing carbohydrate-binding protein [Bryobacteraceae bacterium]|nr:BACON domain-containing carbohydrate-binding protein [Bryobacteraceae bacterium]
MRWVLVLVAVGKLAAQCAYPPTPQAFDGSPNNGAVIPAAGGTNFTVTVAALSYCNQWSVTVINAANTPWITLNQINGQGPGQFTFNVASNPNNTTRQAIIDLEDHVSPGWHITVVQAAATCVPLTLSPRTAEVAAGSGTGSFGVQSACTWNAISNTSWITLPPPANGTGSGSVSYTVGTNGCVYSRTGSITVGAGSLNNSPTNSPTMTFTLTQDGSVNNLSISPQSASLNTTGGSGRVVVTTGTGCTWSFYTDSSWIQITNNGGGSGPSGITYTIPGNTGLARTGHIVVSSESAASQIFTISQAGTALPVPQVTGIENAASTATGGIAPGEAVTLFGTLLGPTKGLPLQLTPNGQAITNNLGGVQVLFDNQYAAALTYVSATQINAIVPYEIAGQATTQITVSYQGGTTAPLQAQVQAASPAVFTLDYNGVGQGAILNQDYSVNGISYPAARGSTVMIFCTGAGATVPASADGAITTGTPALALQPVTVTIGGIPAQVTYSGGAPGAVAGLTQINAMVPPNVTTGNSVPLTIQIGTWLAQSGVTMVVQ